MRKTVDKTRSRSRINGNEPGDREQSAGAHCRNRKYIVRLAGHVLAKRARRIKIFFRSGRFKGPGRRNRGLGFTWQPGRIFSQQGRCARRAKWSNGRASQADGRTFLWRGVPKKTKLSLRGVKFMGLAAEGGLTATGCLVAPPAPMGQTLTSSKQM